MRAVASRVCIYCQNPLVRLPAERFEVGDKRLFVQLSFCALCGWWTVYRVHQGEHPEIPQIEGYSGTIGCIKELDVTDISAPLKEVRQYFLARRDSIYDAHPKLLEDVVCSIFKDLGWTARVTAYSRDGGIDVILDEPSGSTVGIQVKRYGQNKRIEAEQIRSLAGALMLGGHTKGIFVTTSRFRKGAVATAEGFCELGCPIELMDAERFLEALGIAQVQSFRLDPERASFCILNNCIHLGSGPSKEFTPGEDLSERPIMATVWLPDELIDFYGEALIQTEEAHR